MENKRQNLGKLYTFRHGVHPREYKNMSNQTRIQRMPFQENYILHLSQHTGAPAVSIVKEGQKIRRGQLIAKAKGYVSSALHSPVKGIVEAIDLFANLKGEMLPAIKIVTDKFSLQPWEGEPSPALEDLDQKTFIKAVQNAGIVGMGGAAFPAHVKFDIPEEKRCKYLMLNGAECEPFLTCDHRVMVEYADELIDGIKILNSFIQAEQVFIGIEANKSDAILLLREKISNTELDIEVIPFQVKYPQGAEKMMITSILGIEIPSGHFPLEVETLMSNVGTVVALSNYFRKSQPLVERVITVTGTAIKRPSNLLVPIGTSMKAVVEFCGGISPQASRFLLGGPMMGAVQKSLEVPVVKGTSGILALTDQEVRDLTTYHCIRCGRCLKACPLFLNPARLGLMARKGLWDEMEANHVLDCFECAACSFVCPSNIPLVQSFRVAKGIIREQKVREKEKISAKV